MDANEVIRLTRRDFLATTTSGVGLLALASLFNGGGLLAGETTSPAPTAGALVPRPPHFAPRARACIFIYMEGAPSQMDLFDPKPKLNELNGQKLPESLTKEMRFAFIDRKSTRLNSSHLVISYAVFCL